MKRYSHDDLHKLLVIKGKGVDACLKHRSDRVHASPPTDSLKEWAKRKREMMKIYAAATRCKQVSSALEFVDEIMSCIKKKSSGMAEWRRITGFPVHKRAIKVITIRFLKNKKCFSPAGNDYLCFCDEK